MAGFAAIYLAALAGGVESHAMDRGSEAEGFDPCSGFLAWLI